MVNKTIVLTSSNFIKVPITGATETGVYKVNVRTNDINGAIEQSHYIVVEETCEDDIAVKWLSKDGYYKFGTFLPNKTIDVKAKDGQTVTNFFTEFITAKSREYLLSKDSQTTYTLFKRQVPKAVYLYYMDLAAATIVYLNIGDNNTPNWIEVKVSWSPSLNEKRQFFAIDLVLELPKSYTQVR